MESGSAMSWPRCCSCTSTRQVYLVVISFAVVSLMVWLYTDRTRVSRLCAAEAAAGLGGHPPPGAAVPEPPHIDVYVNVPLANLSVLSQSSDGDTDRGKWDYNWDRKAWTNPSDAQGVPMRTILLVRHGQYDLSTGHLNERGRQQANLTGLRLKQLAMRYDRIIHSDMDRAWETAQILHQHLPDLPMSQDPLIAEGGPIPPKPTIPYWSLSERNYFLDGPRMEAAFRKYFYRASKSDTRETLDILVGHGNIFRFLLMRVLQFPPEAWMRVFLPHASISLVHINPDGTVSVTKFGDSGHFPPDMVTI